MHRHHDIEPRAMDRALPMGGESVATAARRLGLVLLRGASDGVVAAWTALRIWRERAQGRRHLVELDPRLLQDIGLTRDAVRAEARKRFWEP